jgi:hypothetical protein
MFDAIPRTGLPRSLYSKINFNIWYELFMWAGHIARMGEKRNAYRILVGKSERKRPFGIPRRRWVDKMKMDLREIGWDGLD